MPADTSNLPQTIRIATRKSKLALWQAHHVAHLIETHLKLKTELVTVVTKGDRILDVPLAEIGGKGLFLKEIEDTLISKTADIAVHSMKDVPSQMIPELTLAAMLKRETPSDALVGATSLDQLKHGAVVGTSSLRRHAQILHARPDLEIKTLRGNVDTRLGKLDAHEYDAIILATAGLKRLELHDRIDYEIPADIMLPAVSQGCVGIQCRAEDSALINALSSLQCETTALAVTAERQCNEALGGSCHAPIAVHGYFQEKVLFLEAMVGHLKGKILRAKLQMEITTFAQSKLFGNQLAALLFEQGAQNILDEHHKYS